MCSKRDMPALVATGGADRSAETWMGDGSGTSSDVGVRLGMIDGADGSDTQGLAQRTSAPDPDLQEANAVTGAQGEEKGDEQQITPAPRI